MENGAQWQADSLPSTGALNGAFPSSSFHGNGAPPNFSTVSSSSRGLSRPRMAKHRKRHVASAMARVKVPILSSVEPSNQDNVALPYFFASGPGWDGIGSKERVSEKDRHFRPGSSDSCSGVFFEVGSGKACTLKFDGGTTSGRSTRTGAFVGASRRGGGSRGASRTQFQRPKDGEKKVCGFSEKVDAMLHEVMQKLSVGTSVHDVGLKESMRDGQSCSSSSAAEAFVFANENVASDRHVIGQTGRPVEDEIQNSKDNLPIFGSIWSRSSFSSLNKKVDQDERAMKSQDGVGNLCTTNCNGMEKNENGLPFRVNGKNANLFSDVSCRFGLNGADHSTRVDCMGTQSIFGKETRAFTIDAAAAAAKNDDFWRFKFSAVKQNLKTGAGCVDSVKSSCSMQGDSAKVFSHISHGNSDFGSHSTAKQGTETTHFDFHLPDGHTMKENMFSAVMQQSWSPNNTKGTSRDPRQGRKMQKLKQHLARHHKAFSNFTSSKGGVPIGKTDADSGACSSPMDFSPSQDATSSTKFSEEVPLEGENFISRVPLPSSIDSATSKSSYREFELNGHIPNNKSLAFQSHQMANHSSGQEAIMRSSTPGVVCASNGILGSTNTVTGSSSLNKKEDEDVSSVLNNLSKVNGFKISNFTFTSLSSSQGPLLNSKQLQRRKREKKIDRDSQSIEVDQRFNFSSFYINPFQPTNITMGMGMVQNGRAHDATIDLASKLEQPLEAKEASKAGDGGALEAEQACEKWRLRGNKAYSDGQFSKAEKYYTHGLNCVSRDESSSSHIQSLVLCYSNRAAARMSVGRIREALTDCITALSKDPTFLKARIRAANCHLILGETEDAMEIYRSCLQSETSSNIDAKVLKEVSDSLKKSQQVADCIHHSSRFLQTRAKNDMKVALESISMALVISPHSDRLIKMKAEALMKLSFYEEVIELCEETLESAEYNSSLFSTLCLVENNDCWVTSAKLWRWNLICKCYFYMGRLGEGVDFLKRLEVDFSSLKSQDLDSGASLASLFIAMQELLRMKAAGNDAFKSGNYLEAVEHYSASLNCNIDSPRFAAICFCNRAAAYQALGQLTNAIADCNLAIVLDGNYWKALSRRATLHEMIRNYVQACNDIRNLMKLLEVATAGVTGSSRKYAEADANSLKHARSKLTTLEEESTKGISLDMYKILGVEACCSASDIKKAYHKAALKHHPDKVAQFFVRKESSDNMLWSDLADEVRRDADCLFKMVGEAYAVLSDPAKRKEYDAEVAMRASFKERNSRRDTNSSSKFDYGSGKQPSTDYCRSHEYSDERQHGYYYRSRRQYDRS